MCVLLALLLKPKRFSTDYSETAGNILFIIGKEESRKWEEN